MTILCSAILATETSRNSLKKISSLIYIIFFTYKVLEILTKKLALVDKFVIFVMSRTWHIYVPQFWPNMALGG